MEKKNQMIAERNFRGNIREVGATTRKNMGIYNEMNTPIDLQTLQRPATLGRNLVTGIVSNMYYPTMAVAGLFVTAESCYLAYQRTGLVGGIAGATLGVFLSGIGVVAIEAYRGIKSGFSSRYNN